MMGPHMAQAERVQPEPTSRAMTSDERIKLAEILPVEHLFGRLRRSSSSNLSGRATGWRTRTFSLARYASRRIRSTRMRVPCGFGYEF
jgi:hypothetical protein